MRALIDIPEGPDRFRGEFREPRALLVAERLEEVVPVLEQAQRHARAGCWVPGFVAYEAAPAFDRAMPVGRRAPNLPLAAFAAFGNPLPFHGAEGPPAATGSWRSAATRAQVTEGIASIRASIAAGEVYQVNLTTRLHAGFRGDPEELFLALRSAQPGGYCIGLDGGTWQVLSVSPELFFDWTENGVLVTRPMKGTAARQRDPRRDARAREDMRASPKQQAENLMIVDLLRNDLGRIARIGSVHVPVLFEAQALPTAWQMTSTVECRTSTGTGLADVFRALFPCGSVTGAPKIAAMAAIRSLEPHPRGVYCGAIGLVRPGGHATFAVAIRTVAIDALRGRAECGIGSGITFDSDARDEYAEWRIKARFLRQATRARAASLRPR